MHGTLCVLHITLFDLHQSLFIPRSTLVNTKRKICDLRKHFVALSSTNLNLNR